MIEYAVDVIIIIIGFTLYAFSHSLLASFKFKKIIAEKIGNYIAFYRLVYNIISVLSLALLIWLLPKPDLIIYDLSYPYDIIILIPQFSSLAGIIWSLRYISTREFLGIEQMKRWINNQYNTNELDEKMTLVIEGPYKYIRHPILFFGGLFLILRPVMDLFYLTCLICIILYIYIGSFFEEKRLIEKFGERYIEYQKDVARFIPVRLLRFKK
jgi:protein-S-isoprenylcysteine O-methyltransferase Ste14